VEDRDDSLARGVLCRALKLGFRPPSGSTLGALFSPEGRRALERAAARAGNETARDDLGDALEKLFGYGETSLGELETTYNRLFGHALRGRVCPYETEYAPTGPFQHSQELADIAAYYNAFGLELKGVERLDHIGCELEFVELLSLKEAYALERQDGEMLEITAQAERSFLRRHLGRFGRAFGASLAREDNEGFYGALGDFCQAFLAAECARLGVPLGPAVLQLSEGEPDNIPMACGSNGDLVQIHAGEPG